MPRVSQREGRRGRARGAAWTGGRSACVHIAPVRSAYESDGDAGWMPSLCLLVPLASAELSALKADLKAARRNTTLLRAPIQTITIFTVSNETDTAADSNATSARFPCARVHATHCAPVRFLCRVHMRVTVCSKCCLAGCGRVLRSFSRTDCCPIRCSPRPSRRSSPYSSPDRTARSGRRQQRSEGQRDALDWTIADARIRSWVPSLCRLAAPFSMFCLPVTVAGL